MSVELNSSNDLTTDAVPRPPRISKENLHISDESTEEKNNQNSTLNKNKNKIENDNGNDEDKNKKYQNSHTKPKFKSKRSKCADGVINYNIINSNGVKIGATTNYTLNLSQISNNVSEHYIPRNKSPSRPMPANIQTLSCRKDEVTMEDMLLIKTHLGNGWKDVARRIGYSDGQIYQFIENYKEWKNNGIDEVIYQILQDWKQANTKNATLGDLVSAMWSSGEYDCVERLAVAHKTL